MTELLFHPDVFDEVKFSYDWYQAQSLGLGDHFLTELENGYHAIMEFRDTWPKISNFNRRYILSKFPYSIIYRNSGDITYVLAVMHNSRKPGYWTIRD